MKSNTRIAERKAPTELAPPYPSPMEEERKPSIESKDLPPEQTLDQASPTAHVPIEILEHEAVSHNVRHWGINE